MLTQALQKAALQENLDLVNHVVSSAIHPGGMLAREHMLDVVAGEQLLEGAGKFRSTVSPHLELMPIWP